MLDFHPCAHSFTTPPSTSEFPPHSVVSSHGLPKGEVGSRRMEESETSRRQLYHDTIDRQLPDPPPANKILPSRVSSPHDPIYLPDQSPDTTMQTCTRYATLLFLCVLLTPILRAQSLDDYWDDRFDLPGVHGTVLQSAVDSEGTLYVLGHLFGVNGLQEKGSTLFKWKNGRWNSTGISGDTLLANGEWYRIRAQMVTIGTTLYVIGQRINYNQTESRPYRVLALSEGEWRTIGEGFNNGITNLATHGSTLYVAGPFSAIGDQTVHSLARWNGTIWETVGGGVNGGVSTMTVDKYGVLYIVGDFTQAGNVQVAGGAKWDGTQWRGFGEEEKNVAIRRLTTVGVTLYGLMWEAQNSVYKLEGNNWKEVSSPIETDYSIDLHPLAADSIGSLYITATRRGSISENPSFLLRFNNNTWSTVPVEADGGIYTTAFGKGEKIFVGGAFRMVNGTTIVNGIAEWNGVEWRGLSSEGTNDKGLIGNVAAVEIEDGYFYAAGTELQCRDIPGKHAILRRHAEGKWETVGEGINGSVRVLLRDSIGGLYAAGCFDRAGPVAALNIARWDGNNWYALGTGPGFCVADITLANGVLYAVGESNLSRWDGRTWTKLAGDINGRALAVAVAANGTVYVGGHFTTAGDVRVNNIAGWSNGKWLPLANGVRLYNSSSTHPGAEFAEIRTLATDKEYLYAGGVFDSAGSAEAYNIARWNGTEWSGMYVGLTGRTQLSIFWTLPPIVHDINVTAEQVFAAGHFQVAGKWWRPSDTAWYGVGSGIAFWDKKEERWNSLGSGVAAQPTVAPTVYSVAVRGESIWIGGNFTMAAERSSYGVGRMDLPPRVVEQPRTTTEIDFGAVPVGAYVDSVLVLTNPSSSTRTLSGRVEIVEGPFSITSNVSFGIAPGRTLAIPVRFTPTSVGFVTGRAMIHHNATSGPQEITVPLWGTGVPPIVGYEVTPTSIDFGTFVQEQANSTLLRQVRITNLSRSTRSVAVTATPLSAPFSLSLSNGDNPFATVTLAPKESIIYTIGTSIGTVGNHSTELVIQHDADSEGAIRIPIQIRVVKRNVIMKVTPNPLDFGDVRIGESSRLSFTVENAPESNSTFTFMEARLAKPFALGSGTAETQLWPGRKKDLTASFTPSSIGVIESMIEIDRMIDGVQTTVQIPVRGRGVEGVISPVISPTEIDFGSITVGNRKQVMLTITNQATATLPFRIEYGPLQSPLSVAEHSSPHDVQPRTTRTYAVYFAPRGLGTYRDTILITHNAPGLPNPFRIPVQGESRLSGVAEEKNASASSMTLYAQPNPITTSTQLHFRTAESGAAVLTVHSLDGREVARLVEERIEPGEHSVEWNTESQPSGVYLCRLKQGSSTLVYTVVVSR